MKKFGQKLHCLRLQRGLTLKELAKALGHTSHSYISELETGKKVPTAELVLRTAILFKVTTDYLLRDEMDINTSQEKGLEAN
jgi:transcriptional regulator with XRE-family HTH domain